MKLNLSRIAKLASLPLSDKDAKELEPQLEETLTYVESLNEVDTKNVEPTSQVTGAENVLRDDEAKESLSQKQALSNTEATQRGFFKVKGVFENE